MTSLIICFLAGCEKTWFIHTTPLEYHRIALMLLWPQDAQKGQTSPAQPRRAKTRFIPSEDLQFPIPPFRGVAEAALYCAHRTSTVSPCAFCEQEGHLAAPFPSLPRPRVARARGSSQLPRLFFSILLDVEHHSYTPAIARLLEFVEMLRNPLYIGVELLCLLIDRRTDQTRAQ